jgi:FAD/FMN-containing dehydrogenase
VNVHAPSAGPHDAAWLETLARSLGEGGILTDPDDRDAYATDLLAAGARPRAVLRPRTVDALKCAVRECTSRGLAIVPRGGGLTYVGGYAPPHERSVIVDLSQLDRIVSIVPEDLYTTVEVGVTWQALHAALAPLGLRTPFFGTFSGRGATIGGGLSNGALFFGTARYGTVADIVLGLGVVLADGRLMYTGQAALERARAPFFRQFGPDLTGLFVHDGGAFGVKATATLRLIRAPGHTGFVSFAFARDADAVATLSELGRAEVAEEAYAMDPAKTAEALGRPRPWRSAAAMLARVVAAERGLLGRVSAGARLVAAGRRFTRPGDWSVHVVCAGRSAAATAADLAATRAIARARGGREIPDSIPRACRAQPFPPLDGVVGARGERWVALNAKVAHSDALPLMRAADALLAEYRDRLQLEGVTVGRLLTVLSSHAFSYEPVFTWSDAWLPLHRAHANAAGRRSEPIAQAAARALVMELRERMVALFREHGAASGQIGRTYPYLDALRPETRTFVQGLKQLADPQGAMNPGVLGL